MAAQSQKIYTINLNINELCNIIRGPEFASSLNIELKSENPASNGVWFRFHCGVTFTSWGEKITITLLPIDAKTTSMTIHSECGMPTQVIDMGKNYRNVCNIYEYIERVMMARGINPANNVQATVPSPAPMAQPAPAPAQTPAFCTNCGARLMPDCNFCTSCGSRVR